MLTVFSVCCLVRSVVYTIRKCGHAVCRDDEDCCPVGKNTTGPCCRKFEDMTYYNISMVTRKLSGVLIMLLLFAVGYFIQRALCSRPRQDSPPPNGHPAATISQEPLMEICTGDSPMDPAASAQLPTYDECKSLPTYEETVRDGCRGKPESSMVQATLQGCQLGRAVL